MRILIYAVLIYAVYLLVRYFLRSKPKQGSQDKVAGEKPRRKLDLKDIEDADFEEIKKD